ncbi:MAG TPA: phosphatase PAP2 family protein [Terriglobales bacterium]|nr:phosphatase PAP2 family protein [Terriglobales bacterium]
MPDPEIQPGQLPEPERVAKSARLIGTVIPLSLLGAILCLLLFSWLAHEVFEGETMRFDAAIRNWVHQFASPSLTCAMFAISWMGAVGLGLLLLISVIVFFAIRWNRAAVWLMLSMAGADLLIVSLKLTFHRPRPTAFFGGEPHSFSFPSGHSLASFCFYLVLAGLISSRVSSKLARVAIWIASGIMVAAIGLSRVYLGVHYPSDVIAGYLGAAVWVGTLLAADHVRARRRSAGQS